ncbi:hypothetical protein CXB51_018866 [Gossypium anomalum]|uniref:Aspartic peptidase DDI1-type domain-containing protein n=1 Tax=Gossypium anomalum TaxID=47600 RepID=A0A8J5YAW9_9ROSI|nr:hypothetical protein CXB51_018866 [Gossypium anomalum]
MLSNQVELLNKKINGLCGSMQVHSVMQCDTSEGGMGNLEYLPFSPSMENEQIYYMGNNPQSQNNPYSNTYNTGWRNHPNVSWRGQGNQRPPPAPGFQQQPYQQEKKLNLEEMMTNNTEPNLKEHVKAVTLRSGKVLSESEKELPQESDRKEDEEVKPEISEKPVLREYKPPIAYPAKLKKDCMDAQFGKFLKLFKQLHINLPFVEAISQMPTYAKFLKELLTNKRKFEELSTVELNEECSAILQNKLPTKLKDLRSFTIPCLIGSLNIKKALADSGASINLMPYKMFKQLGIWGTKAY